MSQIYSASHTGRAGRTRTGRATNTERWKDKEEAAREKDETPRANMGTCSWTLDEIRGVQAAQGSRM